MLKRKAVVDFLKIFLLGLAAFGTGCGGAAHQNKTGTVSGRITYWIGGGPVDGAVVQAGGVSTVTNTDGGFSLSDVPHGQQTLSVQKAGFADGTASVDVNPSTDTAQNVSVLPLTSTLPVGNERQYVLGLNYAWWNYGTDFGTGIFGKYTDWNAVSYDFVTMKTEGVQVVRLWLFADGRYSPEFAPNGGTVTGLDDAVFADVDTALKAAENSHVRLLFTVIDSDIWKIVKYNNGVEQGGHNNMVTDAAIRQSFLDNALKPVLEHVAASPFQSRVYGYDIVNEPERNILGDLGGQNLDKKDVRDFVAQCAAYIHRYHPGAATTVGAAQPQWASNWTGLGLDFYEIHYYPDIDAPNAPGSGLPAYADLHLDKPCIVGEFATNDASYLWSDTNPLSTRWYLETIRSRGYAGALAWSFHVPDAASNWTAAQPVFTQWAQKYDANIGPR